MCGVSRTHKQHHNIQQEESELPVPQHVLFITLIDNLTLSCLSVLHVKAHQPAIFPFALRPIRLNPIDGVVAGREVRVAPGPRHMPAPLNQLFVTYAKLLGVLFSA